MKEIECPKTLILFISVVKSATKIRIKFETAKCLPIYLHICVFLSCYYFGYSLRWPRASRPRSQWHPHLTVGEVRVPFNRTGRIVTS